MNITGAQLAAMEADGWVVASSVWTAAGEQCLLRRGSEHRILTVEVDRPSEPLLVGGRVELPQLEAAAQAYRKPSERDDQRVGVGACDEPSPHRPRKNLEGVGSYSKEDGRACEKTLPHRSHVNPGSDLDFLALRELVCVRYGCWRRPLKYMETGESHQTQTGFHCIKIGGYYCPNCGGGYGGVR